MLYDSELIKAKLHRWEDYLDHFTLPSWEELPGFQLYMDQVIDLMAEYLNFLPADEHGNPAITASTVNNYVRLKIMPPPAKKRYSRIHLAYLIMICTLKQSVSIAYVQKMLPVGITEEAVHDTYNSYVRKHREACLYFLQHVHERTNDILRGSRTDTAAIEDIVFSSVVISGFSKLLAEKILRLQNVRSEDAKQLPSAPSNHSPEDAPV